jgi:acetylornithine deacetylase/succinyl-diaminopimelate desuccinylase-like protein
MLSTLDLTKKLVSLPSYVGSGQDETPLTDYLTEFLAASFPGMGVERQFLQGSKRCNLVLRGSGKPTFFVLGHIDTVQPKAGWQTDPFEPTIKNGSL